MVEEKISHSLCCTKKTFVSCFPIHHGKPVYPPTLSPSPCRIVSKTLIGLTAFYFSRLGVINDNMVGTVVGTYVIFHSSLGMFYGNIFKTGISGSFRSKKQQFEVHHIIDNDRKIPVFITDKGLNTIPRLDTADLGIVSASQGLGGLHDNVFVLLLLCKSVGISKTAIHHETYIIGSFVVFLTFQKCQFMR